MQILLIFFLLFVSSHSVISSSSHARGYTATDDDGYIKISRECAAVLLVGGASSGAAVAFASIPVLSAFGFTSMGIKAGSFAAWWQSTMPLVSSSSLFAKLQSIAMNGSLLASGTLPLASILGSSVAATKVHDFCQKIDDIDKESFAGYILQRNLALVKSTSKLHNINFKDALDKAEGVVGRAKTKTEYSLNLLQEGMERMGKIEFEDTINQVGDTIKKSIGKAKEQLKGFDSHESIIDKVEELISYANDIAKDKIEGFKLHEKIGQAKYLIGKGEIGIGAIFDKAQESVEYFRNFLHNPPQNTEF